MKNSTKIALSLMSLAAVPFISGCGSSTERVKETSATTTYVPSPQREVVIQPEREVVIQPAPVVVSAPPTTVTTTEEKSNSNSTDMGNNATRESSSAYHSESSTVTPMTEPAPSQEQ